MTVTRDQTLIAVTKTEDTRDAVAIVALRDDAADDIVQPGQRPPQVTIAAVALGASKKTFSRGPATSKASGAATLWDAPSAWSTRMRSASVLNGLRRLQNAAAVIQTAFAE